MINDILLIARLLLAISISSIIIVKLIEAINRFIDDYKDTSDDENTKNDRRHP